MWVRIVLPVCIIVVLIVIIVRQSTTSDTATGLVAHWAFDEENGTTTLDASGSGYIGTLVGPPNWTNGRIGGALDFDGANDFVRTSYDQDPGTITLAAWVKLDSYGGNDNGVILGKGDSSARIILKAAGGSKGQRLHFQKLFGHDYAEWVTPVGSIQTGVWYHVAVTYIDASATNDPIIYINGESQPVKETLTPKGKADRSTNPFTISGAFDGIIDEVRIYNRVLSATDIIALVNLADEGGPGPLLPSN